VNHDLPCYSVNCVSTDPSARPGIGPWSNTATQRHGLEVGLVRNVSLYPAIVVSNLTNRGPK
jgi:hypothetical protein